MPVVLISFPRLHNRMEMAYYKRKNPFETCSILSKLVQTCWRWKKTRNFFDNFGISFLLQVTLKRTQDLQTCSNLSRYLCLTASFGINFLFYLPIYFLLIHLEVPLKTVLSNFLIGFLIALFHPVSYISRKKNISGLHEKNKNSLGNITFTKKKRHILFR